MTGKCVHCEIEEEEWAGSPCRSCKELGHSGKEVHKCMACLWEQGQTCQCGDRAVMFVRGKFTCKECALELTTDYIPPFDEITGGASRCPKGFYIVRIGRQPGTGEGNDYFGNHT